MDGECRGPEAPCPVGQRLEVRERILSLRGRIEMHMHRPDTRIGMRAKPHAGICLTQAIGFRFVDAAEVLRADLDVRGGQRAQLRLADAGTQAVQRTAYLQTGKTRGRGMDFAHRHTFTSRASAGAGCWVMK